MDWFTAICTPIGNAETLAQVGAKVGANVQSHQATSGNVQRESSQVNALRFQLRPATGRADLGAGGRGLESRHPDQFSNMLSISGSHSGSQLLSRDTGWSDSVSASLGSPSILVEVTVIQTVESFRLTCNALPM
jgi:hypothetical protein